MGASFYQDGLFFSFWELQVEIARERWMREVGDFPFLINYVAPLLP
jgi:hypothetical protein